MNKKSRSAATLFATLFLLLSSCQTPHLLSRASPPCPAPVIILPPFAIAELSHHDAQYFEGMPYLFSKGYYRAARSLLQARAGISNLSSVVRDRLVFDWALADLHLGPEEKKEGMDLLETLDGKKTPYELREAAALIRKDHRENLQLKREKAQLLLKLAQVKKTLKEFSNLEKSLK